jgi:AraC family transcriptional regulator
VIFFHAVSGIFFTNNQFQEYSVRRKHDLLKNVLIDIEEGIRDGVNADTLAMKHTLSSIHLQRLFKHAFKQPLGAYIRSRRLTASLESLLSTDSKLVNIALDYGYEYEQSYLRSFKREFGFTPGNIRKTGRMVKATPPLDLHGA